MINITITTSSNTTTLSSPYHPSLPKRAKALGGKFDSRSKKWHFDARDEERVREMAVEVYGTDGRDTDTEKVTVRVKLSEERGWVSDPREGLFLGGQQIARASGRDSGATPGEGVVVIEGGFGSGGTTHNWETRVCAGTTVEVRDVPRGVAERILEDAASKPSHIADARIVDESSNRREALENERERLLARIAEIDAEIGETSGPYVEPDDGEST